MITIKTDENNDMFLDENNNLAMFNDITDNASNLGALLNVVKNVVQTHRYEIQLDMNKGIPYMSTIFDNGAYLSLWKSYMVEEISNVENVNYIESFTTEYDPSKYTLSYKCFINSKFGTGTLGNSYVV